MIFINKKRLMQRFLFTICVEKKSRTDLKCFPMKESLSQMNYKFSTPDAGQLRRDGDGIGLCRQRSQGSRHHHRHGRQRQPASV